MNWLDKSLNITILDLTIIATVGGIVVYVLSKMLDYLFGIISDKYSKPLRKFRRFLKYKNIKEAFARRKILKLGYDQALYILVSNDEFMRFLYPNERKYLKRHKAEHEEHINKSRRVFERVYGSNSTPWK
ncbi:hypothetical protein [Planococcus wigleyi]|uniref:Uncharacterized protein n=1 Tax=Planococcus wigleyi TaxID=2762216 RepID=A0ABR8WA43_9BACL|nr:hypothetical protein [Planococcus wigleyi]MBD8013874.1 hypothetical protein [Planococcus wigleyi]